MRVLFVGMQGPFSRNVLERLLANNFKPVAVLLSGPRKEPLRPVYSLGSDPLSHPGAGLELPLLASTVASAPPAEERSAAGGRSSTADPSPFADLYSASPLALAMREGIPTYECGDIGHAEVTNWLTEMSLDVVCVACWSHIIPPRVLGIPRHGFLNVHPSMLPAYRGPFPLFWQFRAGEIESGVSVHWMDAGLDTGDIAGQCRLQFAEGIGGADAEALCAASGGDLLSDVLTKLARGKEVRRPQSAGGSYFPAPGADDFTLNADWHPRRAFNFMRATEEWGVPFRLESKGYVQWLSDALEWREDAPSEPPGAGRVWASFRGGAVLAEECMEAVV